MNYLTFELWTGAKVADLPCPDRLEAPQQGYKPVCISDFCMKPPRNQSPLGLLFVLVLILLAVCARSASGLGIDLPDHDAFATARGNAFAATADDPAAVYYNPAGISQLEGVNFSMGAYGLAYGDHYKSGGVKIDSRTEWAATPDIFTTIALPKYHLTFGLGTYAPYGLVEEWPSSAPFAGVGRRGEIDYYTLNTVVAYQPISSLSLAIGPTFNYSEADLRQSVPANSLGFGSPAFQTRFRGRDEDVGYTAGILWHPLPEHSFGISYRSATDMKYTGHADFPSLPSPPFPTLLSLGGGVPAAADFKFPQSVDFGYSFRPTKAWNLEADAEWLDWETLNTLVLNGTSAPKGSPPLEKIPFDWRSSWVLKFGGTRYFGDGWRASAGYMYVENSVPSGTFNPLIPDSDRHVFSVGIGKRYHKLSWDAAYQLAWGPSRSVTGDTLGVVPGPSPANGKYEFLSHAFTFNVGYHF
ncbi:MAG TPA: outer membrane protein transport protein [Verrucomicrobiae bacterium]|jgi:long-chain fatty acid transport protein|nr:outer membrane protein transport protein [Verrucomicrobiae bacterium]